MARGTLTGAETLEHIDVVAPAHLLASWYPEEADIGAHLLGVHHLVTPRWSGRLGPAPAHGDINHAARTTLTRMAAAEHTPVDWITAADLADKDVLKRRLKTGGFNGAIGVNHVPDDLPGVLDLLLPHSPVVLWPRPDSLGATLPDTADRHWRTWPDGLLLAYRHRMSDNTTDPESCLRTAWHDEQWLEFCHWFETRTFGPLEESDPSSRNPRSGPLRCSGPKTPTDQPGCLSNHSMHAHSRRVTILPALADRDTRPTLESRHRTRSYFLPCRRSS